MGSKAINVYYQPLRDVPPTIYNQLYRLNMRGRGIMQGVLTQQRMFDSDYTNATVFYVKGRKNVIKGWSLVFRYYGKHECHFYVKQKERKKGIGDALAGAVRSTYKNKRLTGYTGISTIFKRNGIVHEY